MVIRTRRAAWRGGSGNGWTDDLVWYAAAIGQMKSLTPGLDQFVAVAQQVVDAGVGAAQVSSMTAIAKAWSDPLSLGFQSQVHGTFLSPSAWPSFQGKKAIWNACAHNHWFFLPWHRAYLMEFEDVVRRHIGDLGGPADTWALPYWNYSDYRASPRRLGLPLPFRTPTLPPGVSVAGVVAGPGGTRANPLFNAVREVQGDPAPGDTTWANAAAALQRPHYATQQDNGRVSFGGGVLEQPNNAALFHDHSNEMGQLDMQPHGATHVHVGGLMSMFETAAIDPIFWLHHANIDRMWETYAHDLGHGYPFPGNAGTGTAARRSWMHQKFTFLRPDGSIKTYVASDVIDVAALGYGYESTKPPRLPAAAPPPPGADTQPVGFEASVPEPVAFASSVTLTAERDLRVTGASDDEQSLGVGEFPKDARWQLRFEGITSDRPIQTSYHVFLGLSADQPADVTDTAHYAGLLSLFGVFESSRRGRRSVPLGQRRILDVTAVVRRQPATFQPLSALVRLVPSSPGRRLDRGLSIDRVTLEYA